MRKSPLEETADLARRLERDKTISWDDVPDVPAFARTLWDRAQMRKDAKDAARPARQKGADVANRDRVDRTDELLAAFEAWRREKNPVLSLKAAARAFFADPNSDTDPDWAERPDEEQKRMVNNLLRSRRRRR